MHANVIEEEELAEWQLKEAYFFDSVTPRKQHKEIWDN